jgi:predicted nicotinamide N-methyase
MGTLFVRALQGYCLLIRHDPDCVFVRFRWNAARSFATYLDGNHQLYRGRSVLELGAGGGLPGIVAAKNGAQKVQSMIHSPNHGRNCN